MTIIDMVSVFLLFYLCERSYWFSKKLNKIEKMLEGKKGD